MKLKLYLTLSSVVELRKNQRNMRFAYSILFKTKDTLPVAVKIKDIRPVEVQEVTVPRDIQLVLHWELLLQLVMVAYLGLAIQEREGLRIL